MPTAATSCGAVLAVGRPIALDFELP